VKGIELRNTGHKVEERIDQLRELTAALLYEIKALGQLKTIELNNGINFYEEVKNFEVYLIKSALDRTGGNQLRAARLLKLKTTTLSSKIKRYDINPEDLTENFSLTD
jgi:transcriptional regulator with GAF, ATPase, and Fis domain